MLELDLDRVVERRGPIARSSTARSSRRHVCGSALSSRASSTRRGVRRRGSVSRFASPMRSASSPLTPRPVRMRSSACEWPMRRGSRTVPPSIERYTPAPAEHAEHRVARRDAQVAPERELEPAGDREALDRGDHRLRQQHPRRSHRAVAVGAARGCRRRRRRPSGRRPRRTCRPRRSGPRRRSVVVGVEGAERVGELGRGRAVDRVAPSGRSIVDDGDARFDVLRRRRSCGSPFGLRGGRAR